MNIYYDKDADLSIIQAKKVAIIGYGSQGHAHAQNLRDSGVDVVLGLRKDGVSWQKAHAIGFQVKSTPKAVKEADVVMLLLPDEVQPDVYDQEVEPNIKPHATLAFAHGFNVHYQQIIPRADLDVIMIAPKGPGSAVRSEYVKGNGVASLIAVYQNPSGHAHSMAMSYAVANGSGRRGIIATNFREETETDLFGEQTVLCGGVVELVKAGFDTLVEAGYTPEMAYLECLHELKLTVDLLHQGGVSHMNRSVSNNAEYGGYITGSEVIGEASKQAMRTALRRIQSGEYAQMLIQESKAHYPLMTSQRRLSTEHPIEQVGSLLRAAILPKLAL